MTATIPDVSLSGEQYERAKEFYRKLLRFRQSNFNYRQIGLEEASGE